MTLPLSALAGADLALVVVIVAARLLAPLLILRAPLLIVVALLLDAVDNSLLALLTDVDLGPDGPYQSVDKALDLFYLTIAYLAAMRNWASDSAFRIAQALLYYRLVGVVLFELLDSRLMLLLFPNTFEYFFIAYELWRTRRDPAARSARFWLLLALGIWVLIKLPQEYWIHIAQRDVTDTIAENPTVGVVALLVGIALAVAVKLFVWPRLPEPDHAWTFAAGPLPERATGDDGAPRVLGGGLLEKVILLALLSVVFAEILPGVQPSAVEVAVAVATIVVANAVISSAALRRARFSRASGAVRFAVLLGVNLALLWCASRLAADADDFPLAEGCFFAYLLTVVIWLLDVYRPVYEARFAGSPLRVASVADLWRRVRVPSP